MNVFATQMLTDEFITESIGTLIGALIAAIIQVILTGVLAQKKDRSIAGWCVAALFFGMIPFIILAFKDNDAYIPRSPGYNTLSRTCPTCGNKIKTLKCPYCAEEKQTVQMPQSDVNGSLMSVKVQAHNGSIHCPKCKLTQKSDVTRCQGCGVKFDYL